MARARKIHRQYEGYAQEEVPECAFEVAYLRTKYLFGVIRPEVSLAYLFACAYLQGCRDTVDATTRPESSLQLIDAPPKEP